MRKISIASPFLTGPAPIDKDATDNLSLRSPMTVVPPVLSSEGTSRDSSGSAKSGTRGGFLPRPSVDGRGQTMATLYRKSKAPGDEFWRTSREVSETITNKHRIQHLRDLCGRDERDIYIDGEELRHIKSLGQGAYAEVEIAEYAGPAAAPFPSPQLVAVKTLKVQVMECGTDVLDFLEEVRVLHRMRHKHIVDFVGFGSLDTSSEEAEWRTVFLVQEFMGGGNLRSMILRQMIERQKTVYTYSQGLQWCVGIAKALEGLHTAKPMVIHRDLKCDNVLLTAAPKPGDASASVAKIADLGLHALVGHTDSFRNTNDLPPVVRSSNERRSMPGSTSTGSLVGSGGEPSWKLTGQTGAFCYMAPEVLQNQAYNEKVDVFSFGVMLFEVFAKRLLCADHMNGTAWDESEEHAHRVAAGWRPPFPSCMPETVRALIDRCWAGVPQLRPSMTEVVRGLQEIDSSGVVQEMDVAGGQGCCTVM